MDLFLPRSWRLHAGILDNSDSPPVEANNCAAMAGPMSAQTLGAQSSIFDSTNVVNSCCVDLSSSRYWHEAFTSVNSSSESGLPDVVDPATLIVII